MSDFIAIDFETANSKRVSACALGYARVSDNTIVESNGYLIKPIGGHASFQSKIHGIKEEHTFDKPYFDGLFPHIKHIFNNPLVAHSLFDRQVLTALSDYFGLRLTFDYIDSCSIAKEKLPSLVNHKLKTLVKYFCLPEFKHHDAMEDAIACARVFLMVQQQDSTHSTQISHTDEFEFKNLLKDILSDKIVTYKEAYELLYWLEDHVAFAEKYKDLYSQINALLADGRLDYVEAAYIKTCLETILRRR